jgi:hypothetical protein
MMFALFLVLAGLALAFGSGAKDIAGRLAKGVVGVALLLAGISCLARSCVCALRSAGTDGLASGLGDLSGLAVLAALAVIGFIAWRRRVERERAKALWEKRNGTPRARCLPTAPPP